MRRKSFNHTLGFTVALEISEEEKKKKITEILTDAADHVGRGGLRDHSLLYQKTQDSDLL